MRAGHHRGRDDRRSVRRGRDGGMSTRVGSSGPPANGGGVSGEPVAVARRRRPGQRRGDDLGRAGRLGLGGRRLGGLRRRGLRLGGCAPVVRTLDVVRSGCPSRSSPWRAAIGRRIRSRTSCGQSGEPGRDQPQHDQHADAGADEADGRVEVLRRRACPAAPTIAPPIEPRPPIVAIENTVDRLERQVGPGPGAVEQEHVEPAGETGDRSREHEARRA